MYIYNTPNPVLPICLNDDVLRPEILEGKAIWITGASNGIREQLAIEKKINLANIL